METTTERSSRRWLWLGGGLVSLLFALALVVASANPGDAYASARGFSRHRGQDFVMWRLDRMLKRLDASAEQRAQVEAILDATVADLTQMHPDRESMHDTISSALLGESIDRAALEALRAEQLARVETASTLILSAIADAAEVLTPEQRSELAEMAEDHRGWRRRGHGWH